MAQLGLDPEAIGLANIAWCASRNDRYPKRMLEDCFEKFTHRLLILLDPDIVILSGAPTDKFSGRIKRLLPQSKILSTLHFAHRKGKTAEASAIAALKLDIDEVISGATKLG